MKKGILLGGLLLACGLTTNTYAQTKEEIKKEVRMTEENGEKVMTVRTTEKGQVKEEVYKGAEADAKMAEMNEKLEDKDGRKKEVRMEEVNGEKTLTIKTKENGKVKEEVYKGEEADRKMKEIEAERKGAHTPEQKVVIKKETKTKTIKE